MKKTILCGIAGAVALSVAFCTACGNGADVTPDRDAPAFSDAAATVTLNATVDRSTPFNQISESLFGVFLEDINYAGYLLDDNLLYNGSFETFHKNGKTWGWTNLRATLTASSSGTGGLLSGTGTYGERKVNEHYGIVNVTEARGVIANEGPRELPIAVEKDGKYLFSAFVKTDVGGKMTVRIADDNKTYASADIPLKTGGWVKYEETLTADETKAEGLRLEIEFEQTGTYNIDGISLETLNSTGGIKQYVYDAIADLSPKFVRFPGGCIIEGDGGNGGADTQEVYDWKNSVGAVQTGNNAGDDDVPAFEYTLVKDGAETTAKTYGEWVTRKQNEDLWGQPTDGGGDDMEYGVGFYEYFLLCDNLGASAVPVLNCGYSCMGGGASNPTFLNGRHEEGVADYIQDAIDLIEFAKGATSTKWGHIRELMGHPEPFEMDYIGIGNEQSGDNYYEKCYEKFLQNADFQKALADYNVRPIVGNGTQLGNCESYNEVGASSKGTAQNAAEKALANGVVESVAEYGVVDQHYYVNYRNLLERSDMYDRYQRPSWAADKYYDVFVGEYSANSVSAGGPNTSYPNALLTALSEAAMMTGFERNGDIVKLAAYAPMFASTNASSRHWAVDMMYYTNTQIVRTANYYIQQLFMKNQGAYKLPLASLKYADGVSETCAIQEEGTQNTFTAKKLYFVASMAENGDLLLKIVNVSGENIKLNIEVPAKTALTGIGYLTEVYSSEGQWTDVNTLTAERIKPHSEIVGFADNKLGQELNAYSATAIRLQAAQ